MFGDDLIFDLIVRGLRDDFLSRKLVFPFIGTALHDLFSVYLSPDARLELHRGEDKALFFLEAETGSVPAWRNNFARSSYWRKIGCYTALWKQYQQDFPKKAEYNPFAVLTLVP